MTITVKVGEAKTHLSELLARVETGEEIVIARGNLPIARLVPIDDRQRRARTRAAIAAILESRQSVAPTTAAEIRAWRDEGRRF